jgi:nitrite reductase/ring-hydroxylating ferredoxin subunit
MLVPLMPMASLGEGESVLCRVHDRDILVACVEGRFFAVDGRCNHAGQSLAGARIRGTQIRCPLHGARFDLATGACTKGPAAGALNTYAVLVEKGKICVEIG